MGEGITTTVEEVISVVLALTASQVVWQPRRSDAQ